MNNTLNVKVFSSGYLDRLVEQATASPRLRQHSNIHINYSDPCQKLFNAIEPESYIRPHIHGLVPRTEMMIAVRGLMAIILFDDEGHVEKIILFGANTDGVKISVGVEIPANHWHTAVALNPGSVLLEIKEGPFDPSQSKELAPWAPAEGTELAKDYLIQLIAAVKRVDGLS